MLSSCPVFIFSFFGSKITKIFKQIRRRRNLLFGLPSSAYSESHYLSNICEIR